MNGNDRPDWAGYPLRALVVGAAAMIPFVLGGARWPEVFFRSYLVGFSLVLGATVGCLAILMIFHLTGGRWGVLLRRLLEAATRTMPLVILMFIPLAMNLETLYPWMGTEGLGQGDLVWFKLWYLSPSFFLGRAVAYFALWVVLSRLLGRWSRWEEETADPRAASRAALLSGPGLVLHGLAVTFASIDWIMSLVPNWFSTIFPVVIGVGQLMTGMAFVIVVLAMLSRWSPLREAAAPAVLNDVGNLLLAMVMFWSYVAFSQFLLIWAGNLPEEVEWYEPRYRGGWEWIGVGLIVCQFALPFVLLLWRGVKRRMAALGAVAAFILVMRVVDLIWEIVPSSPEPGSLAEHGLDIVGSLLAVVGLGGIWLAFYFWQLARVPLLPVRARIPEEAPHHE